MNFLDIRFNDIKNITSAVEDFYSFKKRFNGQAVGTFAQELFVQIINKKSSYYSKDISGMVERLGHEEDLILSKDEKKLKESDFRINKGVFAISLKTASKKRSTSLVIQLTTNYKIRELLNSYGKENIENKYCKQCFENEEIDILRKNNVVVFLFDEVKNIYGIFYIDVKTLLNDVFQIEYKQNRIHATYYLHNKDKKRMAKVLYGTNRANAFQRGIWLTYNSLTSRYFIPLIDWTKFNIKSFDYDFFKGQQ